MSETSLRVQQFPAETEDGKLFLSALGGIVQHLRAIETDPVLIAECPNKFNDAFQDDWWLAAQCGHLYWERSLFFEADPEKVVNDRTNTEDLGDLKSVLRVLNIARMWSWYNRANLVLPDGNLLCIAIQDGQLLVCKTNPIDDYGTVWTLADDGNLVHIASCNRIDDTVGEPRPIRLNALRSDIWRYLCPKARAAMHLQCCDAEADRVLAKAIENAVTKVRTATHWASLRSSIAKRFSWPEEKGGFDYGGNIPGSSQETIRGALADLEKEDWRGVFDRAYTGVDPAEPLTLFVTHERAELVYRNSVFNIRDGTMQLIGLTDLPVTGEPNWMPSRYPANS